MADLRLCSVPDCGKPHKAHDLCAKHYSRLRRHGDPGSARSYREGRAPLGEAKRFLDEEVMQYESDECLMWPFFRNSRGYPVLTSSGGSSCIVSRVVCERVNGPAPSKKHHAAHSCGKGHLGCVNKRHLSWKSAKENAADRLIHDTHDRGERSVRAKLTADDVREIRRLAGTESQYKLAARFGVSQSTVYQLLCGKTWSSVHL